MTRKQQRLALVGGGLTLLAGAVLLVLIALNNTITYFYSPSDLAALETKPQGPIRIGGLVESDSLERLEDGKVRFSVTDGKERFMVEYTGLLPDLFREGQGVVAQGELGTDNVFVAKQVLAKHDENYMPPEVADALKKSGRWQHAGSAYKDK